MAPNITSERTRFWSKVNRTGECWLWAAACDPNGYGRFMLNIKRTCLAHRFAFEQINGPIPDGLVLDHLCRNPPCVNPAHLEAVTQQQNSVRGSWRLRTHCPHGHPYDDRNTIWTKNRHRRCRACFLVSQRAQYHKRKALKNAPE